MNLFICELNVPVTQKIIKCIEYDRIFVDFHRDGKVNFLSLKS